MTTKVPAARQPISDDQSNATRPWFLFFTSISPSEEAPQVLTVSASPFTYQAPAAGTVFIVGGTVSAQVYKRGSNSFPFTGTVVPVSQGDSVIVTYSVVPVMTFVKR